MVIILVYWNIVNKKVAWNWSSSRVQIKKTKRRLMLRRQFLRYGNMKYIDRFLEREQQKTPRRHSIQQTLAVINRFLCFNAFVRVKRRCHNVCRVSRKLSFYLKNWQKTNIHKRNIWNTLLRIRTFQHWTAFICIIGFSSIYCQNMWTYWYLYYA